MFDITLTCWIFSFSHRRSPAPEIISQRGIHSIHSLWLSGLFLLDNLWKISTKWQPQHSVGIPSRWETWILLPTQEKKGSQQIKVKWKNQPKFLCDVNLEMQFQQKSGQTEFGCLFSCLSYFSKFSMTADIYCYQNPNKCLLLLTQ